jgi:hypothetical protein
VTYAWDPGIGPDAAALARMRARFLRPSVAMGEAWFMGETRRMFDELLQDPAEWKADTLASALGEIASGPPCFGHRQEWSAWLPYLIPRAIPRLAGDTLSSVHDGMVTSVMVHYPDPEMAYFPDYPAFRDDLLETLGRARFTERLKKPVHVDASGGLSLESGISASLIFGAKYVRLPDMQGWVASVAEIDDPWWRAALLRWLHLGARLLTDPKRQPHDEPLDGCDWGESHVVAGACPMPDVDPEAVVAPFLGAERQAAFARGLRVVLPVSRMLRWRNALDDLQYKVDIDLAGGLMQIDEAIARVADAFELRRD